MRSTSYRFLKILKSFLPNGFFERIQSQSEDHRIFILPTYVGFYFGFIVFTLFLIAISYGHNLAFFATFLFFGFVALSAIITNEMVKSLKVTALQSEILIGAKHSSLLSIEVTNHKSRACFDLVVEISGIEVALIPKLHAFEKVVVPLNLSALSLQRGHYHLEKIVIATRFPFGLFYAWTRRVCKVSIYAYPKAISGQVVLSERVSQTEGDSGGVRTLGQDEFYQFKDFELGQSLKRLDRKQTLRFDRPIIREFRDNAATHFTIHIPKPIEENALSYATFRLLNPKHQHISGIQFGHDELWQFESREILLKRLAMVEKEQEELT